MHSTEQVGRRSHLSISNRAGYSARQEASLSDRGTLQVRGVLRKSCMYIVPVQVQARTGSDTDTDTVLESKEKNPSIE